ELTTNESLATVVAQLAAGSIFTSSAGGVLGYADLGGGLVAVRFTLPGDVNLDGSVDVGDLGIFASSYGLTSGAHWFDGDFTNDGAVDVGDLGILATNYGNALAGGPSESMVAAATAVISAPPSAGTAAVPEPSSLVLVT